MPNFKYGVSPEELKKMVERHVFVVADQLASPQDASANLINELKEIMPECSYCGNFGHNDQECGARSDDDDAVFGKPYEPTTGDMVVVWIVGFLLAILALAPFLL
jgi:hypothetical protein